MLHDHGVPDRANLESMADAMAYRGPDDQGIFIAPSVGLVHRRLSIRDLTLAGHCPMSTPDAKFHLVFNGEIYNWRQLRAELEDAGYSFISQSDSEVVLQGYIAWGDALAERLEGMFAIAIWDTEKRTLYVARDRLGEKPLFYCASRERFVFASSPSALLSYVGAAQIDPEAIACHLSHTFIPASHTAWNGVAVLPPGTWLTVAPGGQMQIVRYWDFPRTGPLRKRWSTCLQEVESALNESVVKTLDADVPVGVFLSGGVDSSLVAAMAARHRPQLKAFSLGYAEARYSELPFAEKVARHIAIDHHSIILSVDEVIASLPHLVEQYGQPFGDASAVPTYHVSKFAREYVKVCLSGDGGDELFGGYWRLQAGVYAYCYGQVVPRCLRQNIVPWIASRAGRYGFRLSAMNSLSLARPGGGYTNSESWFNCLARVAGPRLKDVMDQRRLSELRVGKAVDRPEASIVQRLLYDDIQIQFPDALLTKVDVASMAASLEVRAPFLDRHLMELAWSLPDRTKLRYGERKRLLKQLAAAYVPKDVVYRPKMGFALPLDIWFSGRLGDYAATLFAESVSVERGYVAPGVFEETLALHRRTGKEATRLWLLLWLELWFRTKNANTPDLAEVVDNLSLT